MKNKSNSPRKSELSPEQRTRRTQQIVFSILGLILILSMILSLVTHF